MAIQALPKRVSQLSVIAILLAVVLGAAIFVLLPKPTKTVTARFERAVGLYAGSSVRLHGVTIGSITKVKPDGDGVLVSMKYDRSIKLPDYPADAKVVRAAIIPPSLVSDRYVQLLDFASCTTGCPVLANGASIGMSQTAAPVELDDIYAALDKLNVALGPKGADSSSLSANGPLSDLIDVGAANLDGNGIALGTTIDNLSKAVQTLANGREDLFGTVKNLQVFTDALVANDAQVRTFNNQLDQVTSALADERGSLSAALKNLTKALSDIAGFIKVNGNSIHTDVVGLRDVTGVLDKQKAALNEILAVAPVAVSNLAHTYNPVSGTLDTRDNLGGTQNPLDPAVICSALQTTGNLAKLPGTSTIVQTCTAIAKVLGGLPVLGGPLTSGGGLIGLPSLGGLVMRRLRGAVAGVLALSLTGALSGCGFHGLYSAPLPGGADLGSHPYHVLVDFADVLDLVPQSAVKVNDVTVGKVESVKLIGWQAEVQVAVNGDVTLPANAYAQIRQTSLLGEKFVSLSYPPGDEVADATSLADAAHPGYAYPHIAIGRTGATPEIEEVLGALSLLLNGGGLEQIKTITHELDQTLSGHAGDIRSLLSQATSLTTSLNTQKSRILTAIDNLDTLARTLNKQKQILAGALDTLPQAVKVLADEKDQFVTLLTSLDKLSTVAVRVVNGATDNFVSALRSLDPVMTQLTKAGDALPRSLELLATFPFPKTSVDGVRGDYTNLYLSADLNLSDLLNNLLKPVPGGVVPIPQTQGGASAPLTGLGG